MSEHANIRHAADQLAGYAKSCRMTNKLEWMEGLAMRLNTYLDAVQDEDRVATEGYSLKTITVDELSRLDKFGYPNQ